MLRHMPLTLRAELRRVLAEVGQDVDRAVGRRPALEQADGDERLEVFVKQVLAAAWRRVVVEQAQAGHTDGLLPGATGIHVGLRRVPPASDGTKSPRNLRELPRYAQGCALPRTALNRDMHSSCT